MVEKTQQTAKLAEIEAKKAKIEAEDALIEAKDARDSALWSMDVSKKSQKEKVAADVLVEYSQKYLEEKRQISTKVMMMNDNVSNCRK